MNLLFYIVSTYNEVIRTETPEQKLRQFKRVSGFYLKRLICTVVVALYCHLVTSTSEISHQPVHTYTTYIYDKGVDRDRKTGNWKKINSITGGK